METVKTIQPLEKFFRGFKVFIGATLCDNQVVVVCRTCVERTRNMNIQDAAKFLGISVRAVERLVKAKKIAVIYIEGKRDFSEEELARFKEQKQQPTYRPALATTYDSRVSQTVAPEYLNAGLEYIEAIAHYAIAAAGLKMVLSLQEAAMVSGLSVNFLRINLNLGTLRGQKLGKGWKIRRKDLQDFIDKIFDI